MQLSAKCENEHFYRYESFKGDSVQTTKGKKSCKAVKKKKKNLSISSPVSLPMYVVLGSDEWKHTA